MRSELEARTHIPIRLKIRMALNSARGRKRSTVITTSTSSVRTISGRMVIRSSRYSIGPAALPGRERGQPAGDLHRLQHAVDRRRDGVEDRAGKDAEEHGEQRQRRERDPLDARQILELRPPPAHPAGRDGEEDAL